MYSWGQGKELNEAQSKICHTRLDYCIKIYQQEINRRETIERKSQFYLSFITLLLGGIFLKLETLDSIKVTLESTSAYPIHLHLIRLSVVGLGISILASLIFIFQSLRVQEYIGPVKENMTYTMFGPESNNNDEIKLVDDIARMYSLAAEVSQRMNNKKAMWVNLTSLSLFATVLFLAVMLGELSYLSLQK